MGQMHVHHLVAATAKEMAGAVYDELATRDNAWYKRNPNRRGYVRATYHLMVEQARGVLAQMLQKPDLDEAQKDQIEEALQLDHSLRRGRHGRG